METETDLEGNCSLFFDDLNDGTDYKIFIVLGSKRSYYPPNLSDDKDIIVVSFTTPFNISKDLFILKFFRSMIILLFRLRSVWR